MSDMTCRYCGARIVWAEGRGWLTVSDSRVVWNTESCVARPTTKGGPEAGHALLEEEPPVPMTDPYVPTTELVAAAREWVQEENWESSYESDGFNRPGTNLITDLADEVERLQSLLATAGADTLREAAVSKLIERPGVTVNHSLAEILGLDGTTPAESKYRQQMHEISDAEGRAFRAWAARDLAKLDQMPGFIAGIRVRADSMEGKAHDQ